MKYNAKFFIFLFSILISISPYNNFAQTIAYDEFLIQLNDFYKIGKSEEADNYAKVILKNYEKEWGENILSKYDDLIQITQKKLGNDTEAEAYIIHKKGISLYRKREHTKALPFLKESLRIRKKILQKGHSDIANSLYTIGAANYILENLDTSIIFLKEAFKNYQLGKDSKGIIKCSAQLGNVYEGLKEYKLAEGYLQLAINYIIENDPQNYRKLATTFNLLGVCHLRQRKYELAKKIFLQTIQIYENNKTYFSHSGSFYYLNLAHTYSELKQKEKSFQTFMKVIELEENTISSTLVKALNHISIHYYETKTFDKAYQYLQKALSGCMEIYPKEKHTQYNYIYHNLGMTFFLQHQNSTALSHFQKAIQQQIQNFNTDDIFSNPDLNTAEWLGTKTELFLDFDFKAKAFFQWYQQSQDIKHLEAAYSTYMTAVELIDLMRAEFVAQGSKLFWLEETYPVFERAIEVSLKLYEKTGEKTYQEQVFTLMEKNKAVLLMESLERSQEQTFVNVPDSLWQLQNQLQQAIVAQERKIIELGQTTTSDSLIRANKNDLFLLQIQLYDLEDLLEKNYAAKQEQSDETSIVSVSEIQQLLMEQQTLIEYFWGDTSLYIATISPQNFDIQRFSNGELDSQIKKFRTSLTAPQQHKMDAAANYQKYTKMAYWLWQKLIQPSQQLFSENISELILIPDGQLAGIPFDVLLSEKADEQIFYSSDYLSYLLNDFSITYHHSASLLLHQKERTTEETNHYFTAFAPIFEGESDLRTASRSCATGQLSRLVNNETEVEQIADLFDSEIFLNTDATKNNFKEYSEHCRILHLATHACMDNDNPSQSRIYFTDDYLYAHELYHLRLKADMVVLSACQTGIGEYQKGEGMMSLARGFAWSGTPSITMSLWSVNDETTSELMPLYYQHLQTGMTKHKALRQAKLDFLNNQEAKRKLHPFYWAAFVHVGDIQGLVINSGEWDWEWLLLLGGIVSIMGVFFFWNKRN